MADLTASGQPIGTTLNVHGPVEAQAADDTLRPLQPGSPLFLHDRIVTGNDGTITILFADDEHSRLDLGPTVDVLLDEDVWPGSQTDLRETADAVERIHEVLLAGTFDPAGDAETASAGFAGGLIIDDGEELAGPDWDDATGSHAGADTVIAGAGGEILVGDLGDDIIYGDEDGTLFRGETEEQPVAASRDNPVPGGDEAAMLVDDEAYTDTVGALPAVDPCRDSGAADNSGPDIDTLVAFPNDEV